MQKTISILPQSFYEKDDVVSIAKDLLGKIIRTEINGNITTGIIVETEAYRGPDDRGCHAYNHRITPRTKTMYMKGGHAYVYICYGMHPMMNVVTGPEGSAHAVLIRAIEPTSGNDIMVQRRGMEKLTPTTTNGPGKLAVALGIEKSLDACLLNGSAPITILDGITIQADNMYSGPRVGMTKHVGDCAHRPWRFYIKDNPWVSKPLVVDYRGKW
jgi:DNA-3-methyladenine glycosylase